MSSLKSIEKRIFEDLFGMASGYVLDFSNNTFAEFFRETTNMDIYDNKYAFNGDSKAKRLRAFWDREPDALVAKVLTGLLEVWIYEKGDKAAADSKYKRCLAIVQRLSGKKTNERTSEADFLKQEIRLPDLAKLQLDSAVTDILTARLKEMELGLKTKAPLSVIFLCGSILEGALLGTALRMPEAFNRANSCAKDRDGRVKHFHEWTLSQLINTTCEIGLLQLDVKKFGHALRDFRNYIHPYEQITSRFSPDLHTAEICFQVLKAALAGLSKQR